MSQMTIEFGTLSLSQQVLERQRDHGLAIAAYVEANAGIRDSTGWLLAMFRPLSDAAVDLGVRAANGASHADQAAAAAVGDIAVDMRETDGVVGESFRPLLERLGQVGPHPYSDLGGPTLGPAAETAPDDHGDVADNFVERLDHIGDDIAGSVSDGRGLVDEVGAWNGSGSVGELMDARSFLVPPQAPDNPVSDLRMSAGVLLGGIDWVAEQFIGFSILERCVFEPLAGDWEGIFKASEAWRHAGSAADAMSRNHASLVASTPTGWEGLSGDSFRVAMTAFAGGLYGLSSAYSTAADLVGHISSVCRVACSAVGLGLKTIADKLIQMAAKAAVPVVGWVAGAVTLYDDIQDVLTAIRRINLAFDLVTGAIEGFVDARTSLVDKLTLIEDLAQGVYGSARS